MLQHSPDLPIREKPTVQPYYCHGRLILFLYVVLAVFIKRHTALCITADDISIFKTCDNYFVSFSRNRNRSLIARCLSYLHTTVYASPDLRLKKETVYVYENAFASAVCEKTPVMTTRAARKYLSNLFILLSPPFCHLRKPVSSK